MLTSVLVIAFLIFFHELGHFVVAKKMGVHVQKFSIGFGPTLISKKYKETTYILALIPLGGYVQMLGQNDFDPKQTSYEKGSYSILHPISKIAILLAGPFANFLLAMIIYVFIALVNYQVLSPKIGKVLESSPAYQQGLKVGDEILEINKIDIQKWKDISNIIQHQDESLEVYIKRDNKYHTIYLNPKIMQSKNIFGEDIRKKMIGISPNGDIKKIELNFFEAIQVGVDNTIQSSVLIFQSVVKLISGAIAPKEIGSVIAIVDITAKASEIGFFAVLGFMALISVNLGVLNLLPIPALDGGHIMFNIYELIFKKAPNKQVFASLSIAGWGILLSVMAVGVYNDINRIFG